MARGVYHAPVGVCSGVANIVEVGFLDGEDVPIFGVCRYEEFRLGDEGFAGVLLEYAELAWSCWCCSVH